MRPLDIAIAVATLERNPDPVKAAALREEVLLALQRQDITAQTYAETLSLLNRVSGSWRHSENYTKTDTA